MRAADEYQEQVGAEEDPGRTRLNLLCYLSQLQVMSHNKVCAADSEIVYNDTTISCKDYLFS